MKLLIADDEALIRDGIRQHIDWERYGIEVAGAAENGLEALAVLEREPVDILVTDIRMPRMDGIELSKEARRRYPGIKIIILSGYEEFEFAQQALELSVMKYLLKPFTRTELEAAIVQAREEVESMRRAERRMHAALDRLDRSLPLLRDRYLNDWVSGRLAAEDIAGKLQLVDLDPGSGQYAVVVTVIDEGSEARLRPEGGSGTDVLSVLLLEDMSERMKASGSGVAFQGRQGEIVAIASGLDDTEALYAFAERIREQARAAYGLTVSVCLGGLKPELAAVAASYREALEAMDYRFLVGRDSIVPYDFIHIHGNGTWTGVPPECTDRMTTAIRSGREDAIRSELARLVEMLKGLQGCGHADDIKVIMTEFTAGVVTHAIASGTRLKELYGREYNPYAAIASARTIDELGRELETLFVDLSRYVLDRRGDRKRRVIEQAIAFIQANYMREELSFQQLSERLGMHPTYFSKLFKLETGTTFTEYVTKVRLDRAKHELHATDLRVSEIAYSVGFRDPFYFSTLFKKHTGLNPTEFRDLR